MGKKINLIYFGSPKFSADFLEKLITNSSTCLAGRRVKHLIEVKLVVTQPDQPVGRKQIITSSPVKLTAQKYNLKCLEIGNWDLIRNLKFEIRNLDFCLLYAYGKKIPNEILVLPRLGFINIHPSLLPKYRGPSPITYPLILGDKQTGVTIIKMDKEIDHGPIINQEKMEILPNDKRPDLEKKLTNLAFDMFKKTVIQLTNSCVNELKNENPQLVNPLILKTQQHQLTTYTKLLKKSDGYIPVEVLQQAIAGKKITNFIPQIIKDYCSRNNVTMKQLASPAGEFNNLTIYNLFRAFSPWPGLWTLLHPAISSVSKGQTQIIPTERSTTQHKRLKITDLALINNKLIIKKVQLEGKKEVDFKTFNKAYKIFSN